MRSITVATDTAELIRLARTWLHDDPDPDTRDELRQLLEAVDPAEVENGAGSEQLAELAERFSGTLQFGTAGLRGQLGAGPMRMNRAVVIRAAAGLASYLRKQKVPAGEEAGAEAGLVVIGYDARYKSADFARDTAAVMVGAGLRAALLPYPLPTPVLAFAVRHLGAVAGVAVTASHNPPRDNGYKVYLGDGSQIVRPAEGWQTLGDEIVEAYLARADTVLTASTPRNVRVVYTPLHGVGRDVLTAAFARAGFPEPTVVVEQGDPDPAFPTVAFPNPEEPGAMDLAFATARAARPDIVIANDPDADRCAVAVPDAAAEGGWRMLRGDEIGAALATHLVHKRAHGTFATTIVSSSLLSRIAAAAGPEVGYDETLTGFKWLSRVVDLRYGYEEALGYCVDPSGVRDKDGVTAALMVAELTAELKQKGRTLSDLLDDIAVEYGLHATDQLSVRVADLSLIGAAMKRLREQPPTALAGLAVVSAEDLTKGTDRLPPTDGLRYHLAGDDQRGVESARVVVRPSGTEPKLKCYLEVVVPVDGQDALQAARATANTVLDLLKTDLSTAAGI
jgi:phosphomannomutase